MSTVSQINGSSAPQADPNNSTTWPKQAIEAASHGAIAFCQIYYEAFDEPRRRATELPNLYLPSAKIIWNGNVVSPDPPALAAFLEALPLSRHDLQTLDCHPIAAESSAGPAPDLILNVTGSALHGPSIAEYSSKSSNPIEPAPQDKPRKFHEMFMLRAAEQGEGMQPKDDDLEWNGVRIVDGTNEQYAIFSQNFRFIG